MVTMDIHVIIIFMDIQGYSWVSGAVPDYPWISAMDIDGHPKSQRAFRLSVLSKVSGADTSWDRLA